MGGHSKAPWAITDTIRREGVCKVTGAGGVGLIAIVGSGCNIGSYVADARLIAAAPDLLDVAIKAAIWFEEYAGDHYRKALNASSYGEQHGYEEKGKRNRERAAELRAAIARASDGGGNG